MTIKEIELRSGMTRANIRFYETEGLLSPARNANGYRDYSQTDLAILKRIKLLRLLHMPLEEIKALHTGECQLTDALDRHIAQLHEDVSNLERSETLCETMRGDGVRYETFDAQPYLDLYLRSAEHPVLELASDTIPKVRAPWRRFFARGLDTLIYSFLWGIFLTLALNIKISNRSAGADLLDMLIGILLMLFLEPLQLTLFGTTLGKWILGIRVTDEDGGRLSYGSALARTWSVLCRGYGLHIPVYALVRAWKSYKACDAGETLEWEYDSTMTLKDERGWRVLAYIGVCTASIGVLVLALMLVEVPRYRGDITAAEFCENYNRLAAYHGIGSGSKLDNTGKWVEVPSDSYTIYIGGDVPAPDFELTETDGVLTGVRFEIELHSADDWAPSCQNQMILSVLSYVCAQDEFGFASGRKKELLELIQNHVFEDYSFTEAGISVTCDVEYSGYMDTVSIGSLWPQEGESQNFSLSFAMELVND